jgi:hypothetical protein
MEAFLHTPRRFTMKAMSVALLAAIVLTLAVAGIASAQGPYNGYGYQPQTGYMSGYYYGNSYSGGYTYSFPGGGNGADNRFGGGYFPPYRRFGGGYVYGPYLRFGGGYGVTPYSSGWSYTGY